jgi:preprotein translocase subunit SecG
MAVGLIMKAMAVLFVLTAVGLVLVVLIQKGRGGGLTAALGGGAGGGLLGSKTGDFLTWVTIVLVGVFLLISVVMAKYYRPTVRQFAAPAPPPSAVDQARRQPATPPMTEQTSPEMEPAIPPEAESTELPAPAGDLEETPDDEAEAADVNVVGGP